MPWLSAQGTPRVQSDARGWPILEPEATPRPAVGQAPPRHGVGVEPSAGTTQPSAGADNLAASPLAPIFQRIGFPSALKAQRGAVARLQVTLFDPKGAEMASFEMLHDADLQVSDRDRLVFPREQRIYGRDGLASWAQVRGLPTPTLEEEAREELELLGRLLRMPWDFADGSRYLVFPAEQVTWQGRGALRVRIEGRPAETGIVGPIDTRDQLLERYELFTQVDSHEPGELRYRLPRSRQSRRVLLLEWREVGSIRMPMRRVVVDDEGRKQLEFTILRLDVMQDLPLSQFQPARSATPGLR